MGTNPSSSLASETIEENKAQNNCQPKRERERERIEEKRRKKKRDIVRKIAFSLLAGGGGIGVGGCFTLGRHATTKALPKSVILTVQ